MNLMLKLVVRTKDKYISQEIQCRNVIKLNVINRTALFNYKDNGFEVDMSFHYTEILRNKRCAGRVRDA